tara:strand:- start:345 stop:2831 length:2487 start_codon:yes stop_codon:yes gene_type:complete
MAQEDNFLTGMSWWKEDGNFDDVEIEDLTEEKDNVEEDKSFLGSTVDFFKNVDYKQLAEESIPLVGENVIIGDIKENLKEGSLGSAALNTGALALGTVPIIGDLAAKPLRALASKYQKARKKVDNIGSKEEWQKQIETLKTEERATTGRDPTGRTLDLEEQAGKFIDETKESQDSIIDAGSDTAENVKARQRTSRAAYIDEVQKKRPITEWKELPHETTDKALVFSLNDGQIKNGSFILPERMATKLGVSTAKIKEGAKVMGRLDIPAYKRYDTWIVTNTVAGQKGSVYSKGLHYTSKGDAPISFRASQAQGEKIGTGQAEKIGYATIVGSYKSTSSEQIRKLAQKYLNDPKWTQVGFDPRKLGSFYTRNLKGNYPVGTAVTGADEVLQLGPLVLAKNVKVDLDYVGYNEGGPVMELEEQTEMAFGDETPRIDPVSGNEVPPGALPSEVRDDIPARLSEGEYVVPADVLQYYGIKFFEDLRGKAKMELSSMEQNGRMGGEPVQEAPMEELPFAAEELNSYEDGAPVEANMGGLVQGYSHGGMTHGGTSPVTNMASLQPQTYIKTYINEEGSKLYIRFINGIAVPPVPPGYVEEGSTVTPVDEVIPTTNDQESNTDASDTGGEPRVFLKDFGAMSATELARFAGETARTTTNKILGFGRDMFQNKAWEDFIEKVETNGTFAQIEYVNNLNELREAGDRDGLMDLAEDSDHSSIMATGSERTASKKAGTHKDGNRVSFVAPDESLKAEIVGKDSGKGKASVMKDNKVLTPGTPGTEYSPSMQNKIKAAKEADYDSETEKQTAVGQVMGKGYVGGTGFKKGGLATRKKKKK